MAQLMTRLRKRTRVAALGLATVLGIRRLGFFIPYRLAHTLPVPVPRYDTLDALFAAHQATFTAVLETMDGLAADLEAIGATPSLSPPPQPRWLQGWFARLDAAAAYTLVRARRPKRIVEIGSGHSTRFMARAVRDAGLETRITAIDPMPRADIKRLELEHIPTVVQDVSLDQFAALVEGDILFVDSSHIAMPGSDVDFVVARVLPLLAQGVLVHFHDILLPDDYPAAWRRRAYNEQLVVAALLAGDGFRPVFSSHYVATRMNAAVTQSVAGRLPMITDVPETSLWLEKTAAPKVTMSTVSQPIVGTS